MEKGTERIQKVLAATGYGSRRACEDLVREGHVQVNGTYVCKLPVLVDTEADDIRIDGRRLKKAKLVYYLLHKPKGVLCTNSDPACPSCGGNRSECSNNSQCCSNNCKSGTCRGNQAAECLTQVHGHGRPQPAPPSLMRGRLR